MSILQMERTYAVGGQVEGEAREAQLRPQAAPRAQQRRLPAAGQGTDGGAVCHHVGLVPRCMQPLERRQHPRRLPCLQHQTNPTPEL